MSAAVGQTRRDGTDRSAHAHLDAGDGLADEARVGAGGGKGKGSITFGDSRTSHLVAGSSGRWSAEGCGPGNRWAWQSSETRRDERRREPRAAAQLNLRLQQPAAVARSAQRPTSGAWRLAESH